jgi:hypothetical protein
MKDLIYKITIFFILVISLNSCGVLLPATNIVRYTEEEIRSAGIEGPYYLYIYPINYNSEIISINTIDRNNKKEKRILKTQLLKRDLDYKLNYQNGTIEFKNKILSFDDNLNFNYIVIKYTYNQNFFEYSYKSIKAKELLL